MKRSRVAILVLSSVAAIAGMLALWFVAPLFMLGVVAGMFVVGVAEAIDYGGRWRPAFESWLRGEQKPRST